MRVAGLDPSYGVGWDLNSLIAGDVLQGSWIHEGNSSWPDAAAGPDGYLDAHQLSALAGSGRSYHQFVTPPGCTSVKFTFSAKEASGKAILLALYAANLSSILASSSITLSTAFQTCTLNATGLSPLTTYAAAILTNNAAQASAPVVTRPSLQATETPIEAKTGVFASDFRRLAPVFGGSTGDSPFDATALYPQTNPFAQCSILTDAARIAIESYGNNTGGGIACLVGGRPYAMGANVASGMAIDDIILPDTTERIVTVQAGSRNVPPGGNYVRAIYLPATANVMLVPAQAQRQLVVWGDSISCGVLATTPQLDAWPLAVRRRYPGVVRVESYGGRSLNVDASTATAQAAIAQLLARGNPTDLWICLGVNDYAGNLWAAAAFGTAYAATLDAIHAAAPQTRIFCQTPILRNVETANGSGSTLGNYRTQITTACSTRAYTTAVDGTDASRFPNVGDLVDGTHPSSAGQRKYADAVVNILKTAGVM